MSTQTCPACNGTGELDPIGAIIEQWIEGNLTDAIDAIEDGGMVTLGRVLVEGWEYGTLRQDDARRIVEWLTARQEQRALEGREAQS